MTLDDAVTQLESFDDDRILCVRRPWTPEAECVVVAPRDDLGVPTEVQAAGFSYFLEVNVAREVLGVFEGREVSHHDRVRLLIDFAENDAYPDWVYAP